MKNKGKIALYCKLTYNCMNSNTQLSTNHDGIFATEKKKKRKLNKKLIQLN